MQYDHIGSLHPLFDDAERPPKLQKMGNMKMLQKCETKLCAIDEGVFNLRLLCQKNLLIQNWLTITPSSLAVQMDTRASSHCVFLVLKAKSV